jgi:hypothetical protein
MKILKKKASEIEVGDILIIDYLEILANKLPVSFVGSRKEMNTFKKKFEGETFVCLFEIDDIELEFEDDDEETGTIYTYHHIDEFFSNGMITISFTQSEMKNYKWNVINNPHKSEHYKQKGELIKQPKTEQYDNMVMVATVNSMK